MVISFTMVIESGFFGANLGMGANFPTQEESEVAAQRLAKLGCNLVRLCIMDAEYAPDGIWEDIDDDSKRTLHPGQLEKLDYLIDQLKQHGIFVDLMLHVSRTLTEADEIVDDDYMPQFNKGVDIFDSKMRDRHKEYATDLLTHRNQYTNRTYYNDPVIAMVEVTNEDSLLVVWAQTLYVPEVQTYRGRIDLLGSYYQEELDTLWEAWWAEHVGGGDPEPRPTRNDIAFERCEEKLAHRYIDFLLSLEEDYHQDMVNYLRTVGGPGGGVQVPISGTQSGSLDATFLSSTFHDQHACFGCWDGDKRFFLDSITKYPFYYNEETWMDHRPIPHISGGKVTGKPYVATELSSPWPNPHAAEPILLAALYGAFQDWDGLMVFAYRGDDDWDREYVAMKYDFDRHMTKLVAITVAALLFRRNDVSKGVGPLMVVTTRQDVKDEAYSNQQMRFSEVTHALGTWEDGFDPPEGYLPGYATLMRRIEIDKGEQHVHSQPPEAPEDHIYKAMIDVEEEEHELEWHYDEENIDDSYVKTDTDNVHVLAGAIDTGHIEIHHFYRGVLDGGSIEVDPPDADSALIAMILVEATPESSTYLIIATGKMENTEFQETEVQPPTEPRMYYIAEPVQENWGNEPVLVEGVGARITLPVSAIRVDCYTLNPDGSEHTGFDPEPSGDQCIVHLSPDNQTLWYKVVINEVG